MTTGRTLTDALFYGFWLWYAADWSHRFRLREAAIVSSRDAG